MSNYGHRVVKTKWAKNKEISFLTGVRIIGLDDVGVINKITNLISGELRININALTVEAKEGLFEGSIKVYVHDKEELEELVKRLKQLNGIHSVDRFDTEIERSKRNKDYCQLLISSNFKCLSYKKLGLFIINN